MTERRGDIGGAEPGLSSGPGAVITSPANPRLRSAAELRGRAARRARGQLLVDGPREVGRALDAGVEIVEVFLVDPPPDDEELAALRARLTAMGEPVVRATPAALARLAYGDRASGIVAVVAAPPTTLDGLGPSIPGLVVILDGVEKPGNLGAICRTADGAGADALIVAADDGPTADPWNPNAVRASLGTVFSMPVAVAPGDAVRAWLRARGVRMVAARVDGSVSYLQADLRGPVALVLGSEARGLSAAWAGHDVVAVRLPMLGSADSLNVGAAAAVLCYEARRQQDAANR